MSNIIRWYGGKGFLYKKILPYLHTRHEVYVEAYAGGVSVFLHKQPSPVEVLNDIDKELINLYRVLQNREKFDELKHRLDYTLYSRAEFERALNIIQNGIEQDDVMRAWAFFVAQNQGFAGVDCRKLTIGRWGRGFVCNLAKQFANKIDKLPNVSNRLRNAYIDCVDALECIRYWDSSDTLFYLDPPYISDTRVDKDVYQHETDNEHHHALVDLLLTIKGQVVLSGYHHEIYEPLLNAGWRKVEFNVWCSAARRGRGSALQGKGSLYKNAPRTEVLYVHIKEDNLFTSQLKTQMVVSNQIHCLAHEEKESVLGEEESVIGKRKGDDGIGEAGGAGAGESGRATVSELG